MTRWSAFLAFFLITHTPARAEQKPCVETETTIVCKKDGFRVLTDGLIDAQKRAALAQIEKTSAEEERANVQKALDACLALPPPAPPAPPKSNTLPLIGFALGAIGAGFVVAGPMTNMDVTGKVSLSLVGLASVVSGFFLVTSE